MLKASECTMYSSGHVGAETSFGECCERWGVTEVTYSFEGHFMNRTKNMVLLNDEELRRGDISMEIISLHMNRQYARPAVLRRVFQTIFHMVNNGMQVFAVGSIQADKTVKGGTGWGVELGKFFNRNVHVLDVTSTAWHTWGDAGWIEDLPIISEATFCGTGTREMNDACQKAMEELFIRSFGPASK
jgi:hypothetical protein